jgi:hypothetical protein
MTVTVKANASPPGNVPVTGITVSPKTTTLGVGESYRPTVTLSPSNATNTAITWRTDNKYVVDLVPDSSGRIYLKGVKAGTTRITIEAQGGNVSTFMTVTVKSVASGSSFGEFGENAESAYSLREEDLEKEESEYDNAYSAYSVEENESDEKDGRGCDAGFGLLALLLLTEFSMRKDR